MPSYVSPLMLFDVVLLLTTLSFTNAKLQEFQLQQQNNTKNHNTAVSPFLMKLKDDQNRRRGRLLENNCFLKPWICRDGLPPFVPIFCCRNRCVNVSSDPDNCGFCGIRCPFGWTCCHGICVDTMVNPLHCGDCHRKCQFPYPCVYGMCGYAEPSIPHPHPHPPHTRFPEPPFPPGEESDNKVLDLREMV